MNSCLALCCLNKSYSLNTQSIPVIAATFHAITQVHQAEIKFQAPGYGMTPVTETESSNKTHQILL